MTTLCWWGGGVEFPNGMKDTWSCHKRATVAVKTDTSSLRAWATIPLDGGWTPLCDEHAKEVRPRTVDWLQINEYDDKVKADAVAGRSEKR